jgi:hypothetical protein
MSQLRGLFSKRSGDYVLRLPGSYYQCKYVYIAEIRLILVKINIFYVVRSRRIRQALSKIVCESNVCHHTTKCTADVDTVQLYSLLRSLTSKLKYQFQPQSQDKDAGSEKWVCFLLKVMQHHSN